MRHPAPEGAQPVNWERLTEEYFGEVQRLRAALQSIIDQAETVCLWDAQQIAIIWKQK